MTPVSNTEIDAMEQALGHKLPGLYRKLLVEEGFGTFGSREIYDPRRIPEIYGCHFDEPSDLFSRYFPFGCDNETQELWMISVSAETAATIWHETNPDDYPDEEWLPYEVWISTNLAA